MMLYLDNAATDVNNIINKISELNTLSSDIKKYGEPSEIRTPDNLIKSQVLCRLS